MANTDKNIIITPANGSNAQNPNIVFSGANNTSGPANIMATITPDANGTLTFSGTQSGNLFRIANDLSNTLYTQGNLRVDGTVSANTGTFSNISGNGAGISNLTAGNITGQVANALVAGTVYTNAQPNITSVGTLASLNIADTLNVSGNVGVVGNVGTTGIFAETLSLTGNANVGNIGATTGVFTTISGNGAGITGVTASIATTAETVTANAQPNITSVGTLSSLSVTGNSNVSNIGANFGYFANDATINGNLYVNGNISYINVDTVAVEDPIIQLGTGPNGAAPNANIGKDVGTALNYYDTAAKIAFTGWDVSNAEIAFGSNVSISSEVVTFTELANIRSGNTLTTGLFATTISASGNANVGNIGATNGVFTTVAGALSTAAQPNITSVGTLTSLSVSGNITAGNLIGVLANGNSNIAIPAANGNINFSVGGQANEVVFTSTGANVNGYLSASGNANVANLGTAGLITATGNINSSGRMGAVGLSTSYGVTTGNSVGAFNATMGISDSATWLLSGTSNNVFRAGIQVYDPGGIVRIYEGANFMNFASNTLTITGIMEASRLTSSIATGTAPLVVNSTTQVANLNAATAGTVRTNAQPNITSTGTLTSVSVSGNANIGNLNLTGNITDTGALSIITGSNGNINLQPNGTGIVNTTSPLSISGNYLAVQPTFRNRLFNGGFQVSQYASPYYVSNIGTNQAGFTIDRWFGQITSGTTSSGTSTYSQTLQTFALGQTAVPTESTYFMRTQVTAVGTFSGSTQIIRTQQAIESVRTLAGQTVTVSFWAKADASRTMAVILGQIFGTGGSPSATTGTGQTFSVTTTWQKFSITLTLPSISGKTLGTSGTDALVTAFVLYKNDNTVFNDSLGAVGSVANGMYLDLSDVQIEEGSVATPFERRPFTTELMLCQRYAQRIVSPPLRGVFASTTSAARWGMPLPVTMRSAPQSATSGALIFVGSPLNVFDGASTGTVSAFVVNYSTATHIEIDATVATGSFTAGRPAIGYAQDGGSLLCWTEIL